jgi:hypothetical protein
MTPAAAAASVNRSMLPFPLLQLFFVMFPSSLILTVEADGVCAVAPCPSRRVCIVVRVTCSSFTTTNDDSSKARMCGKWKKKRCCGMQRTARLEGLV